MGVNWMRPHDKIGPLYAFNDLNIKNNSPLLQAGNKLYGLAFVTCAECRTKRGYLVHFVWGQSGWFVELPPEKYGSFAWVPSHTAKEISDYFNILASSIPAESRIGIGNNL
jgi:hypothetical protein